MIIKPIKPWKNRKCMECGKNGQLYEIRPVLGKSYKFRLCENCKKRWMR